MDPELWDVIKRYTIVGVVLTGAVVWAVAYTPVGVASAANNAPVLEAPLAAAPLAAAPLAAAPLAGTFVVVKHGLRRISCGAACETEARCQLRSAEVCANESCEGEVRKVNRSDFHLAAAQDCGEVAASPCEEACWKKAECNGGHGGDGACAAACAALMRSAPATTWRQARCILEVRSCADVARCDRG